MPLRSRPCGRCAAGRRDDHRRTARLLVARGADPDVQDDRQDSVWLVTGVKDSVAMLETLLPAGPDVELRNRFGGISVIPGQRAPARRLRTPRRDDRNRT